MIPNSRHPYRASIFRGWVQKIMSCRAVRGMGVRLFDTPNGIIISLDQAAGLWPHPWSMTFEFLPLFARPKERRWHAYIRPGFVNGRDVWVPRRINDTTTWHALTDEEPAPIPLTWRNPMEPQGVNLDASFDAESITLNAAEAWPQFFYDLVGSPFTGGKADKYEQAAASKRQLRACDIVLACPRIQTKFETQLEPNIIGTDTLVRVNPVWDDSAVVRAGKVFTIRAEAKYQPPKEPDMLDRFFGTYVEPTEDSIQIGTVWAVSPADAALDAEVDASWELYPQYDIFWNLMHATPPQTPDPQFKPIEFHTLLAGGLAEGIIAGILAPLNQQLEGAFNAIMTDTTYRGRWWNA